MSEQENLLAADGQEETQENTILEGANTNETLDEAIVEIDNSNAEAAENEETQESITYKDYSNMSLEALTIELEKLLKLDKLQSIKQHVNSIKNEFNKKYDALIKEKKAQFIEEGGHEIDFFYSNSIQKRFKKSYRDYRNRLTKHYKDLETKLKENLSNRLSIIEEIKGLLNVEENMSTTYKQFKILQERWRNAGAIPRDKYNNAWNNYHHHVERFYDFLHLNRDLRDLDFKHNLEQKEKLINQVEALAQEINLNNAFRQLQDLHKIWKEELGPVAKEYRESIWERFKAATKLVHDRRKEYFKEQDKVYEKNLETKHQIIASIEAITQEGATNHNDWQNKIKEIEALREAFFKAGKVPLKVNEATWAKFKESVRAFNKFKNVFYKSQKKDQFTNLQKKLDLIKIAENNKDNEDFESTTPLMKKIQAEWKQIGHVPRKDSDKVWKQFKNACNHYFDKIHAAKNQNLEAEIKAFNAKSDLLNNLKNITLSGNQQDNLNAIKSNINTWKTIGRVPRNKRQIENEFNTVLDDLFKTLNVNKTEAELIKFENKLKSLKDADDRHLNNERNYIRKKIDDISSEINQLENNLQFFRNADESNPLVKDVHKNIEKQKEDLDLWNKKLIKLKTFSYNESKTTEASIEEE